MHAFDPLTYPRLSTHQFEASLAGALLASLGLIGTSWAEPFPQPAAEVQPSDDRPRIIVRSIQLDIWDSHVGPVLTQKMCQALAPLKDYEVICEPDIENTEALKKRICQEKEFDSRECSIKFAEHLEADYVVSGRIAKIGRCRNLFLSQLDVEHPEKDPKKVDFAVRAHPLDNLMQAVPWAARQLVRPETNFMPPTLKNMLCEGFEPPLNAILLIGAGAIVGAAGAALDVAPASARNGQFDALDVVPVGLFTVAAVSLGWGIFEWVTHSQENHQNSKNYNSSPKNTPGAQTHLHRQQ